MKLNKSLLIIIASCSVLLMNGIIQENIRAANTTNTTQPTYAAAVHPDANSPKPRIVFENRLLDFGKIGRQTAPSGQFKFTNTGNAVLEISNVSQCCGIVTTLEKNIYKPGEKGYIKVSYNAGTLLGKIARQPIVSSNDPVEPNLILSVMAEIVDKVSCQPDRLKLFLDEDNARCPKVTLTSNDKQPFSIRGIQSTGNCITAKFDPNTKGTELIVDLKVDMKKLQQNMKGNVDIIVTHPETSLVIISYDVLSKYTFNPPQIITLNADAGVPIIRKVWVFNNYNQEFEIESVTSKNNYFTVLSQSKVNNGYQFEVQITPPPSEGKRNFSDELYIQIKKGEKIKIDCNGYYNTPTTTEQQPKTVKPGN
jgi:hypothetical protein